MHFRCFFMKTRRLVLQGFVTGATKIVHVGPVLEKPARAQKVQQVGVISQLEEKKNRGTLRS